MMSGTTMPLSVRMSDEVEAILEAWVDQGIFQSKAEAIRRSLDLMIQVLEAKEEGRRIVSVHPEALDDKQIVRELA